MTVRTGLCAIFILVSGAAFAQTRPDLNDVGVRLIGQTGQLALFLWNLVFVLGVAMTMTGLWKFYANVQNPSDPASRKNVAFTYIFAGCLLVALPSVMGAGIMTFFGGSVSGHDAMGGLSGFENFN